MFLPGHSINSSTTLNTGTTTIVNPVQQTVSKTTTTTTMRPAAATTTTGTFPWWFHINRDWVKSLKGHVTRRAYKYTSRVQTPSEHYLWHSKTRTPNFRKVGSFTNTSAHKLTALKSIFLRLAEHLGTGSKNSSGPHPPSTNIPAPQDIQSAMTVLT